MRKTISDGATPGSGLSTGSLTARIDAGGCMRSRIIFVFLWVFSVIAGAQTKDGRLMTDTEYKSLLSEVDAKLPEWRDAFKRIDPAKTNLPYALGQKLVLYRDIGLMQVDGATNQTKQELVKHSVTRELRLHAFLQGIYDSMQAMLVYDPYLDLRVEKYAPELGGFIGKIASDSDARVELLEKGTCP